MAIHKHPRTGIKVKAPRSKRSSHNLKVKRKSSRSK